MKSKIVYQVWGFLSGRYEFSSSSALDAVEHARTLNVGKVPLYQVERSLIIAGRAV